MTVQDDLQAGARWAPALRALGDERLARMVEGGSDSAFAAIYSRYSPILHGYCRSLLRDDDEAGDALQNAMLKALQAMRRSGRTGPLRPWLFRIAHNESVTLIRQRTRRPGPLDDSMVAGADDAFRHAVAREQLAALLEDLENLSEQQRGALVMRELGGLTYDEIGQALETTPLAARQAVFVAKKRLADGPIAPRRLRPALRQLIPPAPAGFALWGLLGGGASFSAGKALIGAVAVVSVGVGSVELAATPSPVKPKTETLAATPKAKRRDAAVTATATPAAGRRARAVATATPAARRTSVTADFAEVAARTSPTPEATAEAQAETTPAATHEDADRPQHQSTRRPAQQQDQEQAAPAQTPTAQQPRPAAPEQRPGPRPAAQASATREGADCPKPQHDGADTDHASADGAEVSPVAG